ncbi:MAG: hypothetical protein F6J94_05725 [Moorea sp. SIO1F2]|uniref:hypothetical protein n=1 Tax=Moorena sp. SIO1F2 TaxID=2607819 RepID=UPI0013B65326|nr:hypothetical protein [Moorena sp. SIO1F2]NEO60595.1 hypothetical protein [Moorena sp. SIO4G2]NET81468.1 hypothetical protein [Moorena sp. SIO1F2]
MAFGHAIARLRDFVHRVQPVNLGQKATLREQPLNLGQKATLREQPVNLQPSTFNLQPVNLQPVHPDLRALPLPTFLAPALPFPR